MSGFLDLLDGLSATERERLVASLSAEEAEAVDGHWPSWAHDGQRAPPGAWSTWVIKAGRGFGKTLAGAQWVTARIAEGTPIRVALVGATVEDARRVMVEGRSGLIEVAGDSVREWRPTLRRITFHGGAEATLFSGASPDLLRGPEHHIAWCDELAKWAKPQECWDMLQLGLRLGEHPRAIVTTTPRAGPVLRAIMADPATVVTGGSTHRNPHLPAAYRARVDALYAGTRLGRQEIDGELLPDAAGALWTAELIERSRALGIRGDRFARVLIAVDPPTGDGTCGIVAVARDDGGVAHVLADHSVSARSPDGWARAVADASALHGTDEVVAEANQGGRMVKAVLLTADPALRVRLVTASVGKTARAEPVAMLFEAGKVRLNGAMPELEAQLLGFVAGGGYEGPGASPDRADAMVWGVAEVMRGAEVRVRGV